MERDALVRVDRMIAALSPGKQEAVREIVVDAVRRGYLPEGNRRVLDSITQSSVAGDVLTQALMEQSAKRPDIH